MRSKVTTSIDPFLKSSFEITQHLHGKSFTEVLEEGIRQILEDVAPLEYAKLSISQKEQELSELRSKVAELEVLQLQQASEKKKTEPKQDPNLNRYLEDFRNEKFEKTKDSNIRLWRKGSINWKNVISAYQFTDKREAQEWFAKKVSLEETETTS